MYPAFNQDLTWRRIAGKVFNLYSSAFVVNLVKAFAYIRIEYIFWLLLMLVVDCSNSIMAIFLVGTHRNWVQTVLPTLVPVRVLPSTVMLCPTLWEFRGDAFQPFRVLESLPFVWLWLLYLVFSVSTNSRRSFCVRDFTPSTPAVDFP
jgi:hypothetical protein